MGTKEREREIGFEFVNYHNQFGLLFPRPFPRPPRPKLENVFTKCPYVQPREMVEESDPSSNLLTRKQALASMNQIMQSVE